MHIKLSNEYKTLSTMSIRIRTQYMVVITVVGFVESVLFLLFIKLWNDVILQCDWLLKVSKTELIIFKVKT